MKKLFKVLSDFRKKDPQEFYFGLIFLTIVFFLLYLVSWFWFMVQGG